MISTIEIDHCTQWRGMRSRGGKVHQHDYLEILFFADGKADVVSDGQTYQVALYDLIVYPAQTPHQIFWEHPQHGALYSLGLYVPDFAPESILHLRDEGGRMKWLIETIYLEYHCGAASAELLDSYCRALLLLIQRQSQANRRAPDRVDAVLQYIAERYAMPLDMDTLSQVVPSSRSYLSRAFRERTGMTVMQYMQRVRIEAAKRLLLQSDVSVETVAGLVGYVSSKHFSRIFHKETGQTPSQFRKSQVHF